MKEKGEMMNEVQKTAMAMALDFERQPKESDKAFAAFRTYLELGPGRSLKATAEKLGVQRSGLQHWSRRHRWPRRVASYHEHMARVEREASEALVRDKGADLAAMHEAVRRQAWVEAEDMIALAEDFKGRWRRSKRLPHFGAVVRALELAFKLKQFATGMPSEIKQVNTMVSGADGGAIRIEIEAALDKIYGKPIPGEVVEVEAKVLTEGPSRAEDL